MKMNEAFIETVLHGFHYASILYFFFDFFKSISIAYQRPLCVRGDLSEKENKKLNELRQISLKFLSLVRRLGFTPDESRIAAQVLFRLTVPYGLSPPAKGDDDDIDYDLDYSINILVLGKTGVGKSATINSIFGEETTKTLVSAYGPSTTAVTEIVGMVDGVKLRVFDTPGLKSCVFEQSFNRKVLYMVKKLTKKSPPDFILYVDRLDDLQSKNDLPMLRSITSVLGPSIWHNAVITLTHAASAPPDGPSGSPLSYDDFVAERSRIVKQTIGKAMGVVHRHLTNPISLVENHPSCPKNGDGHQVLPNGQCWRPLLLLLCCAIKTLIKAANLSKTPESFDHRYPPLAYLLSCLLHPNADVEVGADSDLNEYDQLPPFKPLKKSQSQIALGKHLVLAGSAGMICCQGDSACGANVEVLLRETDFPIGQDQSSLSLSLVKWRRDLAFEANLQSQFSIGQSYKIAVRAGLNNKLSGQITVRTNESNPIQIALLAILSVAMAIYKNSWPGASDS